MQYVCTEFRIQDFPSTGLVCFRQSMCSSASSSDVEWWWVQCAAMDMDWCDVASRDEFLPIAIPRSITPKDLVTVLIAFCVFPWHILRIQEYTFKIQSPSAFHTIKSCMESDERKISSACYPYLFGESPSWSGHVLYSIKFLLTPLCTDEKYIYRSHASIDV